MNTRNFFGGFVRWRSCWGRLKPHAACGFYAVVFRVTARPFFPILGLVILLAPRGVYGKRGPAARVEPVIYEGVRYNAPSDDGVRGYIQARDTKSGKAVWELTVYRILISRILETDVQWVFIKKISLSNGGLIIVDERERAYRVDLKTRRIKQLKAVG